MGGWPTSREERETGGGREKVRRICKREAAAAADMRAIEREEEERIE